jgi:hypothetical protein
LKDGDDEKVARKMRLVDERADGRFGHGSYNDCEAQKEKQNGGSKLRRELQRM